MPTKYGDPMSTFQFLLFLISAVVFYLFFKQLFSSSYPKRGIDFEAQNENEQIGGVTEMNKTFSTPTPQLSRVQQLNSMADVAIEKGDYTEADKALSSALILESDNLEILLKYGFVLINLKKFQEAKETYKQIIKLNPSEDMAHVALANVLHKLKEDEEAIKHHKIAIDLDKKYAPHYYNYANTLYDMQRKEEALALYKQALELDSSLEEAKKMISELS
jgi:tetratricopeptide (TPR) repeat protein